MNFKDWFAKIEWKHLFILLLIFLVAFGFRTNILKYDLMFEFDTYWHTRMNGDWIETGIFPEYDTMGTYHNAEKVPNNIGDFLGFWGLGYIAYKVVYLGAAYTDDKMIALIRILPALYGALTALAAYLLFRWSYNSKRLGYIAGFIVGIVPGYIYRSMGGFYEEDSLGFFWMVLGAAFLVKALREPKFTRENIIYAALSGLAFGIMSFTWAVFIIVPVIIEAYFVVTLLWNLYKGIDKDQIKAFIGLFAIAFVIMGAIDIASSGSKGGNIITTQIAYAKGALGLEGGASLIGVGSGVGEENTGHQFFGTKYGTFNIFIALGILSILYGVYRRKSDFVTLLFLFWGIGTFYLAWNKLKATYWYGLGLAILASATYAETYIYLSEKKDIVVKVFAVIVGLLLLAGGVASAVLFVNDQVPNIIADPGWKDTVYFMRDKLPENAKMFNWWNWGHWITFMGKKLASTDNTNGDGQANNDFAYFVIDSNFQEALGIIKAYDTDYVVLAAEDISNQMVYASYAYNASGNDSRVSSHFGVIVNCSKSVNPIGNVTEYNCNGNKFTAQQMNGFAINWQSKPNDLYQGRLPIFYYTNTQKNIFWMISTTNNDSTGVKLWFNNPDTLKYFTTVYDNGYQKIFKVNKEAFADIHPFMLGKTPAEIEEWNSKLWWLKDTNSNTYANSTGK